jgi:hypothetical protein
MGRHFFATALLFGTLFISLSCGKDYKTYTDAKFGFSLKYPAVWEYEDPQRTGISAYFREPRGKDENRYVSNIVVMSGEVPAGFSAEMVKNFSLESMKNYIGNFTLITDKKISVNKADGYMIVYEGIVADHKVRNSQIYFAEGGFTYSVIISVPLEEYKKYSEMTEKIIGSFEFKKISK